MHSIATWPGDPSRIALAHLRGRRVALRRRRRDVASWEQGPRAPLRARGGARGDDHALRPQHAPRTRRNPSGCSCSSTAASTAPTTPARAGSTSADPASRPTSASRWSIDPDDPDSAYVIPLVADLDRVTPEGRVRVYETRDAGAIVDGARRRSPGGGRVPHDPAPGVRQRGLRAGRWGSTSARRPGDVFGSSDAGATWFTAAIEAPARPLRTGGLGEASVEPAAQDPVGAIRPSRAFVRRVVTRTRGCRVYLSESRSICSSAPSSTRSPCR